VAINLPDWPSGPALYVLALVAALAGGCRAPAAGRPAGDGDPSAVRFAPAETVLAADAVRVPCDVVGGNPIVSAYVNGRGPFRFTVDTGASSLIVSARLAEQAGARPTDRPVSTNGVRTGNLYGVDSVSLGGPAGRGAEFRGLDAVVVDLSHVRDAVVTIDYPGRAVELSRGRLPPADGRDVVPMRPANDGLQLTVPLDVAGRRVWVAVDSGNDADLVLSPGPAKGLPLPVDPRPVPGMLATLHGLSPLVVDRLGEEARLGRHRLARPLVTLADADPDGREKALLGSGVLRHFVVAVDQRGMVARFTRAAGESADGPVEFPPMKGPPFGFDREDGALVITRPLDRGPSLEALGLKAGDRITAINGRPVAGMPGGDLNDLAAAGAPWVCDVSRGGRRLTVTVPLVVLVP